MSPIRRIVTSYARCHRYAPFFEINVIGPIHSSIYPPTDSKLRYTWFATAKLRRGRIFCRALNVDVENHQWRVRGEEIGSRIVVDNIEVAFADWLESVEDELGSVALRTLVASFSTV